MKRIEAIEDIEAALGELCQIDNRLNAVRETAGRVPLRLSEPGFESLASIIVSQQVSKASAEAMFNRLKANAVPLSPETLLGCDDEVFRKSGLSRPKQRTLLAVADAICCGVLDLHRLCAFEREEALGAMTAISGIGPWTAQVYLMFAAGHPDIFPARDVALQKAVAHAFALGSRPDEKRLAEIAESWRPWRAVAARLFWAYYAAMKGREGIPV
jgi:DNA-3-methyladenine glycosylase II